ncbi:MAG: TonB-dependent receptor [Pseudohongiella sp.]|nr:TonB-dependent receptor [Pseudohongiella sp.]MDO9521211.1 TonB-dependent receptor [Pseudohongiella sp.]MDP2127332.1 TonB-dependent receptor [Pseudohongiella sp.]
MNTKSLSSFRRRRLSFAVALLASASAVPTVYGQALGEPTLEEVVVTGSRLQRDPNMTSAQPVQTIDAETIGNSAVTDLADLLTENPALMASSISSNNSSTGNTGRSGNVGGSALNLRSLGSNRTLTLVNGRRHVSGIEGTSSVDVTTIPSGLIERVEVLTGGASAVYGADAVTGVVNFVLKEDFEGVQFSARGGISGEGDGENYGLEALFGRNFDDGRGNVTVAVQHDSFSGLKSDQRGRHAEGGNWTSGANPMRRFQQGDIDAATMPNLARFYNYTNTRRFPWGMPIPTNTGFNTQFTSAFGAAPNLTQAERDLLDRPNQVTPLTLAPGYVFNITSPYGVVGYGAITSNTQRNLATSPDLDGNGVADCLQSWTGFNSPAFGGGGCWYIDAAGNLIPYQDGLVIDGDNQYGATQSFRGVVNPSYLMPEDAKVSINLTSKYDVNDNMRFFGEAKYVRHEVTSGGGVLFSTDLLYSAPDNPFIPAALQPYARQPTNGWYGPGIYTSRDSEDYGNAMRENKRDTYRFVGGVSGTIDRWELNYELSANYGEFRRTAIEHDTVIIDRFFASLDVVTNPATGQPVCRSDLDPTAYAPTSPWNFPRYLGQTARTPFFTFSPGDGQCVPANVFGGHGGLDAASEFFTYDRPVKEKISQSVVGGFVSGTSAPWFELPAGSIAFAAGFEWREETSKQNWHEYDRGIIQVAGVTQYGVAYKPGDWVGDVTTGGFANSAKSLGSSPSNLLKNGSGQYDVLDFYAETSIPLLNGVFMVEELTLDAAVRSSDYSTFGKSTTWGAGLVWMPVDDIRFRYSINEAVRVPNIYELFAPIQGATFNPRDPCSVENIKAAPNPGIRQTNCVASLQSYNVPLQGGGNPIFDESGNYSWINPLTASFSGETGGNLNLLPETGTTETFGVVVQPRFIPGLSLTVDYWDIEIMGSIETIAAQDIVNGCYDAATLNNPFCALLRRQNSAASPQVGGFSYLLQGLANMSSVKARGIDMTAGYRFDLGPVRMGLNGTVTKLKQHDVIEPANPGQVPRVNVGLGELNRPEWGGQFSMNAAYNDFSLNWRTRWQGEQVMTGQIETARQNYGDMVFSKDFFSHNLSARYGYSDSLSVFGGVGNVTNEQPYVTSSSTPVTMMGRSYYVGVDMTF